MTTPKAEKATDKAIAKVQAKADEELEKGYRGYVPDENPNSAYSPLTGPDAPPLVADNASRVPQPQAPAATNIKES